MADFRLQQELTAYLDAWMESQATPMHSTTLERIVDGVLEFMGERRTFERWTSARDREAERDKNLRKALMALGMITASGFESKTPQQRCAMSEVEALVITLRRMR